MSAEIKKPRKSGLEWKLARWGWYFVIPGLVFFAIFSFYPIINAFYLSFHRKNMISPLPPVFVGFDNYISILKLPSFWNSIQATLIFTLGTFIPLVIVSLILATFITRQKRFARGWQLIYYSPAVLSSAVAALIWMIIFQPTGIANQFVNAILFTSGVDRQWLSNGNMVRISTMIVYFWKYVGYFTILFMTGLTKIPQVIYEGATIDGAGRFQTFFKITLPLLKPTTVMVSVMAMLQCLKTFSTQYLFTQSGAPRAPIDVITLNIYTTAMREYNVGRSSVMSILLFLTMLILTIIQLRASRSDDVSY
ncbi:carbohydrate ABC transporter permease [Breznakiella homolactica]|uniref:Sugar ABC transporter permease n=1 Tax=Breznakiella homolactica TaxID=2798577 RepID=A0A7T8BBN6_9SPIR|nr:sugar ABC transporter permease [Breznakiella homolactica]QQO10581.1 sugar ABC transporter permease [Breznakiella homolactica]